MYTELEILNEDIIELTDIIKSGEFDFATLDKELSDGDGILYQLIIAAYRAGKAGD